MHFHQLNTVKVLVDDELRDQWESLYSWTRGRKEGTYWVTIGKDNVGSLPIGRVLIIRAKYSLSVLEYNDFIPIELLPFIRNVKGNLGYWDEDSCRHFVFSKSFKNLAGYNAFSTFLYGVGNTYNGIILD